MIFPYIMEVIEFIRSLDLDIEMFTNGFGITAGVAKELFANKCLKQGTARITLQWVKASVRTDRASPSRSIRQKHGEDTCINPIVTTTTPEESMNIPAWQSCIIICI